MEKRNHAEPPDAALCLSVATVSDSSSLSWLFARLPCHETVLISYGVNTERERYRHMLVHVNIRTLCRYRCTMLSKLSTKFKKERMYSHVHTHTGMSWIMTDFFMGNEGPAQVATLKLEKQGLRERHRWALPAQSRNHWSCKLAEHGNKDCDKLLEAWGELMWQWETPGHRLPPQSSWLLLWESTPGSHGEDSCGSAGLETHLDPAQQSRSPGSECAVHRFSQLLVTLEGKNAVDGRTGLQEIGWGYCRWDGIEGNRAQNTGKHLWSFQHANTDTQYTQSWTL